MSRLTACQRVQSGAQPSRHETLSHLGVLTGRNGVKDPRCLGGGLPGLGVCLSPLCPPTRPTLPCFTPQTSPPPLWGQGCSEDLQREGLVCSPHLQGLTCPSEAPVATVPRFPHAHPSQASSVTLPHPTPLTAGASSTLQGTQALG